jgi:hypothetical protein
LLCRLASDRADGDIVIAAINTETADDRIGKRVPIPLVGWWKAVCQGPVESHISRSVSRRTGAAKRSIVP